MTEHTKGLLRVGKGHAVVADHPVPEMSGSDALDYYGGHMVAESVTAANARRIVACWNLLHEFDTEAIEAGTFADFIGKQVYLHEIGNANSGELRLSDVSLQLMAAGLAGKMKANAAENYMEFGLFHPDTGPITITVQRAEGLTPVEKLEAMTKQRDVLLDALNGVLGVMNNSQGVAGWHQNGVIATWDELLPEVATALEFVEGEQS
ncbi:hypothetical protein [Aeromonas veronii]|uniref:hypothetical protein n=1 Tax=Aeromonas veronii TaxID=654 RepID=UPI0015DC77AF|nr:hypothetical protein [Aeromonas veronii]BBU05081.1 hypothetical protein WP9W18E04_24200 [Aeromonas veronii]